MRPALRVDCIIRVVLWYSIFSYPVKADCATFKSAWPKMVRDAIWIRGVISGRLKMVVAKKPERR